MTIITEKKAKLENILKSINNIVRQEAIKERDFISKLNRDQLLKGEKADGDTPNYVIGSNQPSAPGKITLFEAGDFHEGIEPLFEDKGFEMVDTDFKTPFLVAKFGNILGLNKDSIIKLRARLFPRIKVRAQL